MKFALTLAFAILLGIVLYAFARISQDNACTSIRAFNCPQTTAK